MSLIISNATNNINTLNFNFGNLIDPMNWESNYLKYSENKIQKEFIETVEYIDQLFCESNERKLKFYCKDTRPRTIVTAFGCITFNRRRYTHIDTGKNFYYIDYILGLNKYQRVTNQVLANIIYNIGFNHDSYRRACEAYGLTKSFVYQLIKRLNPEVYVPYLDKPLTVDYLHIVADEDHVALQKVKNKRNSYCLNHVTIFTDVMQECKGRTKLLNKVIFTQLQNETTHEFRNRINEFILNNYIVKNDIYVYGDGAAWIRELANDVCGQFVLDQFHFQQAICKIAGGKKNTSLRNLINKYVSYDYKDGVKAIIDYLYPDKDQMPEYKKRQKIYILRQYDAYRKNQTLPNVFHGCAEGINSHYFSDYLSSRPKGFCVDNLHKLGYILGLAHSNHDLRTEIIRDIDIYLPEKIKITEILRDKVHLDTLNNIPIINTGKATNTCMNVLLALKN